VALSSSSASVAALIMPRSATTPMRAIRKRVFSRSVTDRRVVTSVVLPGPNSEQIGRPRPSMRRRARSASNPGVVLRVAVLAEALAAGALEIERGEVVSRKTRLNSLNRLLRKANSRSSTRSLVVQGTRPRALVGQFVAEPCHGAVQMVQFKLTDPIDHGLTLDVQNSTMELSFCCRSRSGPARRQGAGGAASPPATFLSTLIVASS